MIRVVLRVAICLVLLGGDGGADERAEQLRVEGMRDYDAGRYDAAIVELEQAYALGHERSVLYALGQAQRRKGDCRGAIVTFDKFIALAPPPAAVGAARFQIARCLEQLGERGPSAAPPVTPTPQSQSQSQPQPQSQSQSQPQPGAPTAVPAASSGEPPPRPRRWYQDAAGDALAGVGVGVGAVGAALLGTAELRARRAGDDLQAFRDAQSVGAFRTAGIVVTAAGAVLVIAAVARWAVVAGRSPQRGSVVPTNDASPPPRRARAEAR